MEKIKNETIEVPSTKEMNDENILNDVLMNEKNISNNFSIALDEMSNKYLYKEVFEILRTSKDLAREAYDLAFKNGWYELTKADEKEISNAYDKSSKKLKEI